MAEDLILARVGIVVPAGTATSRRRLLRNQGNVVYDIYHIHFGWQSISILTANQESVLCLSTRKEDQVNDETPPSLEEMFTAEGLFGAITFITELVTSGGTAVVAAHEIAFQKPYTVPWLSGIFRVDAVTDIQQVIEVWFTRRNEQPLEKASLVARLGGGRARTQ